MDKSNNTIGPLTTKYWSLIPSDPDVFDDMIKEYGVKDIKAEQLLSVELDNLEDDGPVYGLVFISEYSEEPIEDGYDIIDPDEENIIFTSQIVTNACATLAIIGVLLNADIKEKGEILTHFEEFTKGFSPINRGICLGNSEEIRRIHNAYTPAHQKADDLLTDTNIASSNNKDVDEEESEDYEKVYHYVTYIYKNGFLWEMDGLNPRPKKVCKCERNEWLTKSQPLIQKRMNDSNMKSGDAYDFSLIVIKHDPFQNMVTENESLKTNIKKLDKIIKTLNTAKKITVQKHSKQFHKEANSNSFHYTTLSNIWNAVETLSFDKIQEVKEDIELIRKEQLKLDANVKMYEESRKTSFDNACRQKFDYFPFLELITRKALKRGLLNEEVEEKQPANKKQKVITPKKPTPKSKAKTK